MKKILDRIVSSTYNLEDLLMVAGVVVAFLLLIGILMRVFRKKEVSPHFEMVECLNCGWKGKVSAYRGRCPKCNQPLGEQKAGRR